MRIEANREAAEFVRAKAAVGANTFRALPDELKARGRFPSRGCIGLMRWSGCGS